MKSLLLLLLMAALLCGCGAPQAETPATVPTTEQTEPTVLTEPQGIYLPFTELETRTGGAVRAYAPDLEGCYGMRLVGRDVLLFSGSENTTLTRLSGDNLFTVARIQLSCRIDSQDPSFQVSDHGITYYDAEAGEVIFLDNDLKEVSRLAVSRDISGSPILSSDRMRLYYCTADAVRVYDLETGLERMIRSVAYPEQLLEAVLAEDQILRIRITDERGRTSSQFLSADTGELLEEYAGDIALYADKENYFSLLFDGLESVIQFRLGEAEPQVLYPQDREARIFFLPGSSRVVTVSAEDDGTRIRGYDLLSGRCASELTLTESLEVWNVLEDGTGFVYLLGLDRELDQATLLRWQWDGTPCPEETVYTGPRYTRENPDLEGLALCDAKAQELSERFGVKILLGEAALARLPQDYELEDEYQVGILNDQLTRLEACLASFPEGFFKKISYETEILLVRAITGKAESGSVARADGLQFWDGDTACLALSAGERLEGAFFHELFHILDSQILSDSRVYYYWRNLNPEGFAYSEDYTAYLNQDLSAYLQEENRAFIDAYSTTFPKEDRARIMEYASTPGNEAYFRSEIMQSKLQLLCQGIREVFGLKNYTEPLIWEQYLLTEE